MAHQLSSQRRTLLSASALYVATSLLSGSIARAAEAESRVDTVTHKRTKEEWLDEWQSKKSLGGPLQVQKFKERVYVLLSSISWSPNPGQFGKLADVPIGFVTDFASVPRAFWSLLPPDGEYTYPAVIHDYLYWTQTGSKKGADLALKYGMEELGVGGVTVAAIYNGVKRFGSSAWNENSKLKQSGERRILKEWPKDPKISWTEWKLRKDVWA